jgi:hypothetical protein
MSRPRTGHLPDVVARSPGDNASMSFPRSQAGAPVAGEESSVDMTGVVSNGPDRPIRLLVVDDDPRVRQAIAPRPPTR